VTSTVELKREQVRRILQVAPSQEQHVRDLEAALATYLRKATDTFDLSRNVEVREASGLKLTRFSAAFFCVLSSFLTGRFEVFSFFLFSSGFS
jgi:hypothetical protein